MANIAFQRLLRRAPIPKSRTTAHAASLKMLREHNRISLARLLKPSPRKLMPERPSAPFCEPSPLARLGAEDSLEDEVGLGVGEDGQHGEFLRSEG